jgi:hypothetical protein
MPCILVRIDADDAPYRVLLIGNKRLPDCDKHARYWGFVDMVTCNLADINGMLDQGSHTTKTLGIRRDHSARMAGEGLYEIVRHTPAHTHLMYVLEAPAMIGPAQQVLGIGHEGCFSIQIKSTYACASSSV